MWVGGGLVVPAPAFTGLGIGEEAHGGAAAAEEEENRGHALALDFSSLTRLLRAAAPA